MKYFIFFISCLLFLSGCCKRIIPSYILDPKCDKAFDEAWEKYCAGQKQPLSNECHEKTDEAIHKCYESLGKEVPWAHENCRDCCR